MTLGAAQGWYGMGLRPGSPTAAAGIIRFPYRSGCLSLRGLLGWEGGAIGFICCGQRTDSWSVHRAQAGEEPGSRGRNKIRVCPLVHKVVWTPAFSGGHDASGRALRGEKLLRRDQANEEALAERQGEGIRGVN